MPTAEATGTATAAPTGVKGLATPKVPIVRMDCAARAASAMMALQMPVGLARLFLRKALPALPFLLTALITITALSRRG